MSVKQELIRWIFGTIQAPAFIENLMSKFDIGIDGLRDRTQFIVQDNFADQHVFVTKDETEDLIEAGILGVNQFVSYDPISDSYTLAETSDGQTQNLGQEIFISAYNDNAAGASELNPKAFFVNGSKISEEWFKTVHLAIPSNLTDGVIFGINTTSLLVGEYGKIVTYGETKDVNTSLWSLLDILYVDEASGNLTNIRPIENIFIVGVVTKVGATDGIIFVNTIAGARSDVDNDTVRNLSGSLNGIVPHKPKVEFYDGGAGIIYAEVTDEIRPTKKLQYLVGATQYELDTLTGAGPNGGARVQIPLSVSPSILQTVFIYVDHNGGSPVLGASTSYPFTDSASIGTVEVRDYTETMSEGVFGWRRSNDALDNGSSDGFNRWLTDAIRIKLGTTWQSGCVGTPTPAIGVPTVGGPIRLATTSGNVVQMHVQGFDAQDGLNYWVYNDSSNETYYEFTDDLGTIVLDAKGDTLVGNNVYYRLSVFALNNSVNSGDASGVDRLLVSRPLGSYAVPETALLDTNGFDVDISDTATEGLVTKLYTIVIGRTGGGGTIEVIALLDNRSRLVGKNTGVGGSAGAGGVTNFTELNDTPTVYTGEAGSFLKVNSTESALEYADMVMDINGNIAYNGAAIPSDLLDSYYYEFRGESTKMYNKTTGITFETENCYRLSSGLFKVYDLGRGCTVKVSSNGDLLESNVPVGIDNFLDSDYQTRKTDENRNIAYNGATIPSDVSITSKSTWYSDTHNVLEHTDGTYDTFGAYYTLTNEWSVIGASTLDTSTTLRNKIGGVIDYAKSMAPAAPTGWYSGDRIEEVDKNGNRAYNGVDIKSDVLTTSESTFRKNNCFTITDGSDELNCSNCYPTTSDQVYKALTTGVLIVRFLNVDDGTWTWYRKNAPNVIGTSYNLSAFEVSTSII